MIVETLWRVTVSSLFPNDHRVESTYEGRYADEKAACNTALSREATENGGSTIATIVKAEKVR
jgi:hypothetical protein